MFNNQDVEVVVNVTEAPDGMHIDFDTRVIPFIPNSMAYGGKDIFDWDTDASDPDWDKWIVLNDDAQSSLNPNANHTAKHEFGHILGLGDAYYQKSANMPGINVKDYPDLQAYNDNYKATEKDQVTNIYDAQGTQIERPRMVMDDSRDPVRPNDIEMVILAWSTGKRQNYQKQFPWNEISEALGKGN